MTGHVTYFKSSKSLGLLWRGGGRFWGGCLLPHGSPRQARLLVHWLTS